MSLPNTISLARLMTVPLIIWLIVADERLAAFVLFVLAGLSDAVDGFIAKRYDATTPLGTYLDPLADKALLVGVYVTLGLEGYLPAWLVILVAFRDLIILGGALLLQLMRQLLEMVPLKISKANTAAQITLASVVLGQLGLGVSLPVLVDVLILVVAATTVLSGASYIVQWSRRISNIEGER